MRIAICKGALFDPTVSLLNCMGLDTTILKAADRQLFLSTPDGLTEYLICRPTDVPVFVEYGSADIGITGKDVLLEQSRSIYELYDLGFGKCRMVLAEPAGSANDEEYMHFEQKRVATKFPNITEKYFSGKGIQVEIIRLHGNIELAPAMGLADMIVDLSATGRTLKENNLRVIDEIAVCTARLIANRAAHKLNFDRINELLGKIRKQLEA